MTLEIDSSPPLKLSSFLTLSWGEPYRLLFPLGIVIGILGVAMWPLFYSGWISLPYPVPHHAHLMIQGFFGSFVFGFLGTAMPRMLTAPKLKVGEVCYIIALLCLTAGCHLAGNTRFGDGSFLLLLLSFVFIMRSRFIARQDVPPPGFVLVLLGWLSAVGGTSLLLLSSLSSIDAFWYRLANLLLFQGFLLFPIMGIGAFLFPRFFGMPSLQEFDESRSLPPGWIPSAAWALICGLIVMSGFIVEANGELRMGPLLRLLGAGMYFGKEVPFFRTFRKHGTLGVCLGTALLTLMTGMLCQALFPQYGKSMEHVVLIGGFGLLTMTVATRVILGHSGQSNRFKAKILPLLIMMILVVVALATRVSADVFPDVLVSHQIYAALIWIIGVGIWAFRILPGVLRPDEEE